MANRKLTAAEVRLRFASLGHQPTFVDDDYTGAFANLSYICGNCGSAGFTTVASVTARLKRLEDKRGYCPSCGHSKGVDAASDAADKIVLKTRDGEFTLRQAAEKYSLTRNTLKSRVRRNWTPDEVCGIVPRSTPRKLAGRSGWVYGWWCKTKARYVYIGLTAQGVRERVARHFADARNGAKTPFHTYLRECGDENFEVRVLWEGDASLLPEKESFYIAEHQTLTSQGGLNLLEGGSVGCLGGRAVEYNGKSYPSLKDVWRECANGIAYRSFCGRLKKGWPLYRAVEAAGGESC